MNNHQPQTKYHTDKCKTNSMSSIMYHGIKTKISVNVNQCKSPISTTQSHTTNICTA